MKLFKVFTRYFFGPRYRELWVSSLLLASLALSVIGKNVAGGQSLFTMHPSLSRGIALLLMLSYGGYALYGRASNELVGCFAPPVQVTTMTQAFMRAFLVYHLCTSALYALVCVSGFVSLSYGTILALVAWAGASAPLLVLQWSQWEKKSFASCLALTPLLLALLPLSPMVSLLLALLAGLLGYRKVLALSPFDFLTQGRQGKQIQAPQGHSLGLLLWRSAKETKTFWVDLVTRLVMVFFVFYLSTQGAETPATQTALKVGLLSLGLVLGCSVGFVITLRSSDPALEKGLAALPHGTYQFFKSYGLFALGLHEGMMLFYWVMAMILVKGCDLTALAMMLLTGAQGALVALYVEYWLPLRHWTTRKNLWKHPRNILHGLIALLVGQGLYLAMTVAQHFLSFGAVAVGAVFILVLGLQSWAFFSHLRRV